MKISTGAKITIERDDEVVGAIRFDPSDVLFMERVYDLMDGLEKAQSDYEARAAEIDKEERVDQYGIPLNGREQVKLMRDFCEFMHAKIDGLFGDGTSEMVFAGALSMDTIFDFLDGLTPHLEQAQAERIKKYTNRAQRRGTLKR